MQRLLACRQNLTSARSVRRFGMPQTFTQTGGKTLVCGTSVQHLFRTSTATVDVNRWMHSGKPLQEEYLHFHKYNKPWSEKIKEPKYIVVFILLPALGLFYYYTHLELAPETGRSRFIDVSNKHEKELGEVHFQQFLQQNKSNLLPSTHTYSKVVTKVGGRIAKASGKNFDWEFVVVDQPHVNAFCLPGGKVVVFTGLLKVLKNEDQLAAVMAHEVAHALARHGAEKMAGYKLLFLMRLGLGLAIQTNWLTNKAIQILFELPYSRTMETEADTIGLLLMARACYDPKQAKGMYEILQRNSPHAHEYLSTHPSPDHRIKDIEAQVPKAELEREKYCPSHRHH